MMKRIRLVSCHRMPERSFFYRGKQFPVCSRCTGIHVGYLVLPFFVFNTIYISPLWTLLLIIPAYLDGFIQAYTKWESNNPLRFITGIIAGVGSMSLVSLIGDGIGEMILNYIK